MAATRLVIIGGVAGGATAAARARRLCEDARIIVLERGPFVSFANCGLPYHIGGEIARREKLLLQTPESLHARHRLDVRVRSEVQSIDRDKQEVLVRELETGRTYGEPYDKLIVSTGAAPVRPPLPGIEHGRIFTLRNVPDTDAIKAVVDGGATTAVIIGGGFIGLEMAENLRRRGLAVELVEMLDQVMPPLDPEMADAIHGTLTSNGVQLHLGDAVSSFDNSDGQVAARLESGRVLTADLAILAIGVRPESKLAADAGLELGLRGGIRVSERMETSDPNIYAVGDAVTVADCVTGAETLIPLAGPANRQARIAADNIFGRHSAYRGTQGTSIVRVFDLNVAMTGASEKVLREAGVDYEKVYLHPAQHVGYFPGAATMHLKLLFGRADGRVLGAQITGGEGVDKRIDVLAMAVQSRMTVYDLEQVELGYAPQFGAAKDPVNMAGFVAANTLRGDVRIFHANAIDKDALLLDVRSPAEHQAGAIPGSRLIPLDALREHLDTLPKDRRIQVYCAAGLRGYVAARILSQSGFDAWNLSGGFRTYQAFHPDTTAPVGGSCAGPCAVEPTSAQGSAPPKSEPARRNDAPDHTLDVCGEQCPGPIVALSETLGRMNVGEALRVKATDPGFAADVPAWCRQTGHELLDLEREDGHFVATIRKRDAEDAPERPVAEDKTLVVFSNDLDRAIAAFIIANGAASMGRKVTLFFTFWGLSILRNAGAATRKSVIERAFGWMLPRGPEGLSLSKMNMAGLGTRMMRRVMRQKNVASLPQLIATARASGVRMVACAMSMDVLGIQPEELIDGTEIGGVGTYLDAANTANVNLFI